MLEAQIKEYDFANGMEKGRRIRGMSNKQKKKCPIMEIQAPTKRYKRPVDMPF